MPPAPINPNFSLFMIFATECTEDTERKAFASVFSVSSVAKFLFPQFRSGDPHIVRDVANVFLGDSRLMIRPVAPRIEMEYFVLRAANHDVRPESEEFVDSVRKAAREISKRVSNYASR